MKYQIIYADPPWQIGKGGKKDVRKNSSGGALDYPTIPLQEIQSILFDATALGDKDHAFFMWTIDKYLHDAEKIGKDLGYRLHARMIWNKVTGIPAAFTIRFGHEYLLWFYKERLMPIATEQRGKWHSVMTEQVTRHSQKPEIAYKFLESIYPNAERLELFARKPRQGWDVWGNEVESDIDLAALNKENDNE
jgi:N6-adenosine-specific RNA methylase IME4